MFIGEYYHNLDTKKRLAVPAKFRTNLGKKAVLTRGLDNCLYLYPMAEWKKLAEKLSNLPITRADSRAFARLMLAGAMDVSLDRLGRIVVPEYLKKYASLGKKTVVAGLYNKIEIWSQEKWETYRQKAEKNVDDLASKLGELGL